MTQRAKPGRLFPGFPDPYDIPGRWPEGEALKAAMGTFVGFLLGTGLKLLLCFYVLYELISTWWAAGSF